MDRSSELKQEAKSMLGHEAESREGMNTEKIPALKHDYNHLNSHGKHKLHLLEALAIFDDRNAIYKDTFVHLGLLGTTVTLVGDVFRLRNMIIHNAGHGRDHREQIEDKLLDVINQAAISLRMLREDNFEGK